MARFRIAHRADDPQLTELSREVMHTRLGALEFSRGGSLLGSLERLYDTSHVIVCEDGADIVGMGVYSHIRASIFNEESATIGYLSQLRSKEQARGKTYLVRAYNAMKCVVSADGVALCVTAILKDNVLARSVLEGAGGRAGGQGDAGPHTGQYPSNSTAARRGDCGLRDHRSDASLFHC